MALAIPTSYVRITRTVTNAHQYLTKIKADLFWETLTWIFYIFGPIMGIPLDVSAWFVHDIFFILSYFLNLSKTPKMDALFGK